MAAGAAPVCTIFMNAPSNRNPHGRRSLSTQCFGGFSRGQSLAETADGNIARIARAGQVSAWLVREAFVFACAFSLSFERIKARGMARHCACLELILKITFALRKAMKVRANMSRPRQLYASFLNWTGSLRTCSSWERAIGWGKSICGRILASFAAVSGGNTTVS